MCQTDSCTAYFLFYIVFDSGITLGQLIIHNSVLISDTKAKYHLQINRFTNISVLTLISRFGTHYCPPQSWIGLTQCRWIILQFRAVSVCNISVWHCIFPQLGETYRTMQAYLLHNATFRVSKRTRCRSHHYAWRMRWMAHHEIQAIVAGWFYR